MIKKRIVFPILLQLVFVSILINCASLKNKKENEEKRKFLSLTFCGDIMAHDVNFMMKDYNAIYDDIHDFLNSDDLTFGNIEMPVCDELPMSTYPRFNVHSPYIEAAVKGGFDIFSMANNHTNDQGSKGINGTLKSIDSLKKNLALKGKKIYYSGLYKNKDEEMKPEIILHKGWNIVFLSVSEISNSHDESIKRFYYSSPSRSGRKKLLEKIRKIREENPCSIFVLSLHLHEEEYLRTVSAEKKAWFKELANNGADIIWAHHPHVMQEWEEVKLSNGKKAFFMYSMGNFISGQRNKINLNNPAHYREYTGDAALLRLEIERNNENIINFRFTPFFITCYKSEKGLIIKEFTKSWIETLSKNEQLYFKKRIKLMKEYLPIKNEE